MRNLFVTFDAQDSQKFMGISFLPTSAGGLEQTGKEEDESFTRSSVRGDEALGAIAEYISVAERLLKMCGTSGIK
jgi:hypothetical protein